MKKTSKVITAIFLALVLMCFTVACEVKASDIEVTKLPTKSEYFLNETFSAEGGEITATLQDGTKSVVSMTDEKVKLSTVKTAKAGKKTITVNYGGARTRFTVEVKVEMFTVSFDLGADELEPIAAISVAKDSTIDKKLVPATMIRDGFEFVGWYIDKNFTEAYKPEMEITANMTLYAQWLDASKIYFEATFDNNYYGGKKPSVQNVEEGKNATAPKDPTRTGYKFEGWFSAKTGGTRYNFGIVGASITLYAQWTKTATGSNEYKFEGEDIDFTGKESNGFSGTAGGTDMICLDATGTASNGRYIGWTYREGLTLEFKFVSDAAVSDAKIVARFSAEFGDMSFTNDKFLIELNGIALPYPQITIDKVPTGGSISKAFADFTIALNVPLIEGANEIVFIVNNSDNWLGAGQGTIGGTAPLIDCIKITTQAVLYWDGTFDLPKKNYR